MLFLSFIGLAIESNEPATVGLQIPRPRGPAPSNAECWSPLNIRWVSSVVREFYRPYIRHTSHVPLFVVCRSTWSPTMIRRGFGIVDVSLQARAVHSSGLRIHRIDSLTNAADDKSAGLYSDLVVHHITNRKNKKTEPWQRHCDANATT